MKTWIKAKRKKSQIEPQCMNYDINAFGNSWDVTYLENHFYLRPNFLVHKFKYLGGGKKPISMRVRQTIFFSYWIDKSETKINYDDDDMCHQGFSPTNTYQESICIGNFWWLWHWKKASILNSISVLVFHDILNCNYDWKINMRQKRMERRNDKKIAKCKRIEKKRKKVHSSLNSVERS